MLLVIFLGAFRSNSGRIASIQSRATISAESYSLGGDCVSLSSSFQYQSDVAIFTYLLYYSSSFRIQATCLIQQTKLLGHLYQLKYSTMHSTGDITMLREPSFCFSSFGDHSSLVGFQSPQVQPEW